MDWNANLRAFVPVTRPETTSFDFLYNYNYDHFPGNLTDYSSLPSSSFSFAYAVVNCVCLIPGAMEMKQLEAVAIAEKSIGFIPGAVAGAAMEKSNMMNYGSQEKKKRLTSDQLESLERSFQEEIKLDPDRKMKLSRELGLQPRQIAVWFQNRRARWKSKQLELLYDALKQEYDAVSRDKQKLQQEVIIHHSPCTHAHSSTRIYPLMNWFQVIKLKSMLREQGGRNKQVSTGMTEVSGEETVESTSAAAAGNSNVKPSTSTSPRVGKQHQNNIADCNYLFNVEEYNPAAVSSPFWSVMPATYQ